MSMFVCQTQMLIEFKLIVFETRFELRRRRSLLLTPTHTHSSNFHLKPGSLPCGKVWINTDFPVKKRTDLASLFGLSPKSILHTDRTNVCFVCAFSLCVSGFVSIGTIFCLMACYDLRLGLFHWFVSFVATPVA